MRCRRPLKKAAPLSICTKEERRAVIRFLIVEDVKPAKIISRLQAQYGDNCLTRKCFKQRRASSIDVNH
ncbi:hypothetical protein TNCV_4353331 [Trichonephila clavipes]|nr:hypothetical protein TNCV_4353331 [Trichonephila clavipes]